MKIEKEKRISSSFKLLVAFFVCATLSVVFVYRNFEQGVEDFWKNTLEETTIGAGNGFSDVVDLDNYEKVEGVSDFKDELVKKYIERCGDVSVFEEIFPFEQLAKEKTENE